MSTVTPAPALEEAAAELAGPGTRRRMLIIVNPYASTVSDRLRHLVVYALQGRFEVDAVDTEERGHATVMCREAAHEGYDIVVAFGGDGTVNEAANGLLGSATPLCPLPGGSANVFAKMLGIPGDVVDATEHILGLADDWSPRRVDVGEVNGRAFTFAAGLGLDASVVERVDARPHLKARLGPWFFTGVAVTTYVRRYLVRPPRLEVLSPSGDPLAGVTAVVQNGTPFTYFDDRPIHIVEGAALDSGTLSAAVLHRATPAAMPSIAWRALSSRAKVTGNRQITGLTDLRELLVRSADDRELPLQVDGDYIGTAGEARFGIKPKALTVVA